MSLTGINGATYVLEKSPIASGGEGDVYRVANHTGLVAKIYKPEALSSELADKLRYMAGNPPSRSVLSQVAWPEDVVCNELGDFSGFIMPKLQINASLSDVYKYPSSPGFQITMRNKIMIAQNICVVINEIHSAGYVFGDFNPLNTGLDRGTGRISFLDTDTYHVYNESGISYRCNVCAPGYCAPELLEKVSDYIATNPLASQNAYAQTPLPTFTRQTDNFALSIHIFKLLMNGYTPYGGIIDTASASQASPGIGDAAVRRDSYCFRPGYKHQSSAIPEIDSLPNEIADLFTLAFIAGRTDPSKRPSAEMWYAALEMYEQVLIDCKKNAMHQYDRKNTECPLCAADKAYMQAIGQAFTSIQMDVQAPAPIQSSGQASAQQSASVGTRQPSSMPSTTLQNQPYVAMPRGQGQSQIQPSGAKPGGRNQTQQPKQPASTAQTVAPQKMSGIVQQTSSDLLKMLSDSSRMHNLFGRLYIAFGVLGVFSSVLLFIYMPGFGAAVYFGCAVYMIVLGVMWIKNKQDIAYLKRLITLGIIACPVPLLSFMFINMFWWRELSFLSFSIYTCVLVLTTVLIVLSLVYAMRKSYDYSAKDTAAKICGNCGKKIPPGSAFCRKCGYKF